MQVHTGVLHVGRQCRHQRSHDEVVSSMTFFGRLHRQNLTWSSFFVTICSVKYSGWLIVHNCISLVRPSRTYTQTVLRRNGLDCPTGSRITHTHVRSLLYHYFFSTTFLWPPHCTKHACIVNKRRRKGRLAHASLLTLLRLSAPFIILEMKWQTTRLATG